MDPISPVKQGYLKAPGLAAALMYADLRCIVLLYPIIILPGLLLLYRHDASPISILACLICERILQLVYFAILGTRAINSISRTQRAISPLLLVKTISIGGVIWAAINLPQLMMLFTQNQTSLLLALIVVIPGAAFAYRSYLYCLALLLGRRSLDSVLSFSRQIISQARTLPIRVELVGAAFLALFVGIAVSPAPDGHLLAVNYLAKVVSGISWVLTTYLAIAYGLMQLSSASWQELGLEPYRDGRIETLSKRAPTWLTAILYPRRALSFLGVAILILGMNQVRASQSAPHATMRFLKVELNDVLRITVQAEDEKYHFRGFRPELIRIAGESGIDVTNDATNVFIDGKKLEFGQQLPSDQGKIEFVLEFKPDRPSEQLKQLKDLYIWYNRAKLEPLKLTQ